MTNEDKLGTALITGASAGIGAAYARRLAERGYDLILVARNEKRLRALAEELLETTGRAVEIVVADLLDAADLKRISDTLRTNSSISVLVNNAGVGATTALVDSKGSDMHDLITLNIGVLSALTFSIAPAFVSRGKGTIINIASSVALAPEMLNGVYGASKAYVLAFTQSLQHELGAKGVRVQVVLPGATATDFWSKAGLPIQNLPKEMVMSATDLVDAALAGLDRGEVVTIPSLPDVGAWNAYEDSRLALRPLLSLSTPAARYRVA